MRDSGILTPLTYNGSMHRQRSIYYTRGIIFTAVFLPLIIVSSKFCNLSDLKSINDLPLADNNDSVKGDALTAIKIRLNTGFVLNEHKFTPLREDSIVIVIQVHTRLTYLRYLIKSLSKARGISSVLLIFSHDYYDRNINDLVQSVDFCKVMQIFYPYPSHSHKTCTRSEGSRVKCNTPEFYKHNKAELAQMKHHWWWQANYVFDQLTITRRHRGLVFFLDEDFYIAEDVLYVLKLMYKNVNVLCPYCKILAIGNQKKPFHDKTYSKNTAKVNVFNWVTGQTNLGYAFNRSTWNIIRDCAPYFCSYNDYNWDRAMNYLSNNCRNGAHYDVNNCRSESWLSDIEKELRSAGKAGRLFPRKLVLDEVHLNSVDTFLAGKGWYKKPDQELCISMTSS
uniref:Alpha-1,6-mannosyl-glycoprotein 2-beta-N-acetylglucosaminyltransferase n=1 Tax=Glossina brevipalpis TaxID=37001 RepID=A0A1A9VZ14_9MUSC